MRKIDPLFAYFSILAVIQPARIQDIEASARQLLSPEYAKLLLEGGHFRAAHETARERGLVAGFGKSRTVITVSPGQ